MTEYINRDAAIRAVKKGVGAYQKSKLPDTPAAFFISEAIRALPAVQPIDPATIRAEALRDKIAAKAREYADHYPQSSDGRNTFLIFAEWVEDLALIDKEKDQ